ncbi:hypothetical protein MXD62_19435 [Frankia sp. Mgl5]|uniref:hypothetical protein n=1 Tax=Frankia sp. Mgl5 TaxID=2933793 RepID=UPI0020107852|nr:hypothetical protein [Frankia sp. Mgl5]MCK9929325.1 hypothetical protein [Frankia sp. Mgl5]
MNIIMRVLGADAAAAQLLAAAAKVEVGIGEVVASQGAELQTAIKAAASGRPGPNVITDAFRSGITLEVERGPGHAQAEVSSASPQANRLEFGFNGTDSLGRRYNQPPYPSFGPGFDAATPGFTAAVTAMVRAAL